MKEGILCDEKQRLVISLLKKLPRPVSTKEIIQKCGYHFKPPLLYDMSDRGLIVKVAGCGTQAWRLNPGAPPQSDVVQRSHTQVPIEFHQHDDLAYHDYRVSIRGGLTRSQDPVPLRQPKVTPHQHPSPPHQHKNIVMCETIDFERSHKPLLPPPAMAPLPPIANSFQKHSSDYQKYGRGPPLLPHKLSTGATTPQTFPLAPHYIHSEQAPMISTTSPIVMTPSKITGNPSQFLSCNPFNALNKNPVSALNETAQKNGAQVTFEVLSEDRGYRSKLTVAAKVGDRMYDSVTSSNMKDARRDAADAALRVSYFSINTIISSTFFVLFEKFTTSRFLAKSLFPRTFHQTSSAKVYSREI